MSVWLRPRIGATFSTMCLMLCLLPSSAQPVTPIGPAATTQEAVATPADDLTQLSREMLRLKLRSLVSQRTERHEQDRLTGSDSLDPMLQDTQDSADVGRRRIATARLLEWADQPAVRRRLEELAHDDDALVKLNATMVLATDGRPLNVAFLHELASGRGAPYSSSGFEREEAAWTLLALGERLTAPANDHINCFEPLLEAIHRAHLEGHDIPPTALAELEDWVFLRNTSLELGQTTGTSWSLHRKAACPLVWVSTFSPDRVPQRFDAYLISMPPTTARDSLAWTPTGVEVAYGAVAADGQLTWILASCADQERVDQLIQTLGLSRVPGPAAPAATLPQQVPHASSLTQAITVALAAARGGGHPMDEYTLTAAERLIRGSKYIWRITFRPNELLPSDPQTPGGLGGELFVHVDMETGKTEILFGE